MSRESRTLYRVFVSAKNYSREYDTLTMSSPDDRGRTWTLLTGHGHVLVEIARNPDARIRDIAVVADLTERAVQAIVADLEAAGYLTRSRDGRRNTYTVNPDMLFRHRAQEGHRVGPFLALLSASGELNPEHGTPDEGASGPVKPGVRDAGW
jgi:DNA-binding MarR family transcriptional regulator